jgi:hypothetical protein
MYIYVRVYICMYIYICVCMCVSAIWSHVAISIYLVKSSRMFENFRTWLIMLVWLSWLLLFHSKRIIILPLETLKIHSFVSTQTGPIVRLKDARNKCLNQSSRECNMCKPNKGEVNYKWKLCAPLFKAQRFGDWILSPSSCGAYYPEKGTSSVDWGELSRFHLFSPVNVYCLVNVTR